MAGPGHNTRDTGATGGHKARRRPSRNTQLFALAGEPPPRVCVLGRRYRLACVFKHDFFAATTLYEAQQDDAKDDAGGAGASAGASAGGDAGVAGGAGGAAAAPGAAPDRIVVKFCRVQGFCGIDGWHLGRLLLARERRAHRVADGLGGVQRWLGGVEGQPAAFALEYVEGRTLDQLDRPPPGEFFDELADLVRRLHAADLAYGDLNKRGNIVVTPDGRPVLLDFQLALHVPSRPAGPAGHLRHLLLGGLLRAMKRADLYHVYKHKRRLRPECLRSGEEELGRRLNPAIRLHRLVYTPLKTLRRRFLTRRSRRGLLVSPTEALEPMPHGETTCWRRRVSHGSAAEAVPARLAAPEGAAS